MLRKLRKLEKETELTPVQKILLITDGSITRILEAVRGEDIEVITLVQEVVKSDARFAEIFGIPEGAEVNHRIVWLKDSRDYLVHATSYCPLTRLDERFRTDIMKGDTPIGKIMKEHLMEARREIRELSTVRAAGALAAKFNIIEGTTLIKRNYDIIYMDQVLLNITEVFSNAI